MEPKVLVKILREEEKSIDKIDRFHIIKVPDCFFSSLDNTVVIFATALIFEN